MYYFQHLPAIQRPTNVHWSTDVVRILGVEDWWWDHLPLHMLQTSPIYFCMSVMAGYFDICIIQWNDVLQQIILTFPLRAKDCPPYLTPPPNLLGRGIYKRSIYHIFLVNIFPRLLWRFHESHKDWSSTFSSRIFVLFLNVTFSFPFTIKAPKSLVFLACKKANLADFQMVRFFTCSYFKPIFKNYWNAGYYLGNGIFT